MFGKLVCTVVSWVRWLPVGGLPVTVSEMTGEFICPIPGGVRVLLVQEHSVSLLFWGFLYPVLSWFREIPIGQGEKGLDRLILMWVRKLVVG